MGERNLFVLCVSGARAHALFLALLVPLFLFPSISLISTTRYLEVRALAFGFLFCCLSPSLSLCSTMAFALDLCVTVEYATLELTCRMCVCACERVLVYFTTHESCEKWMKCVTNRVCVKYVTIRSCVPCCVCASVYEGIYHI